MDSLLLPRQRCRRCRFGTEAAHRDGEVGRDSPGDNNAARRREQRAAPGAADEGAALYMPAWISPTQAILVYAGMQEEDVKSNDKHFYPFQVMVEGRLPPKVKRDAHDVILDFIRSRPPLKPVSEFFVR